MSVTLSVLRPSCPRGAKQAHPRMRRRTPCLLAPNLTDAGLGRLIELLETQSPLLVHGCFPKAVPMGCLATHAAWNHPATEHLMLDAGINWLHRVAHLNPATSVVIREWDRRDCSGRYNFDLQADLLAVFREELRRRDAPQDSEPSDGSASGSSVVLEASQSK